MAAENLKSVKVAGPLAALLQVLIFLASLGIALTRDSIAVGIIVFFVAQFVLQFVGKVVYIAILTLVAGASGDFRR